MLTRKTLRTLALTEGIVLWLIVVGGTEVIANLWSDPFADREHVRMRALVFAASAVTGLYFADLYDIVTLRRRHAFFERLPVASGVALCLLAILYALFPDVRLSMHTSLTCAAAGMVLLSGLRAGLGHAIRRGQPERVLVLGEGPPVDRIVEVVASRVRGEEIGEHIVVGVISLPEAGAAGERQFEELLRSTRPDRIVVAANRETPLPLRRLLQGRLHGIAVEDWVPFYERLAGRIALESLSPASVAFGDGFGEARIHAAFARAVGLLAALIGLIVAAPFLLVVAAAIRLTSPGPVLFVQQRVGRNGRPYGLLKLRTMRVAEHVASEWVRDNQDRITPIGRWLRRFRLDELPQLINVLKGDMNLVGPRPHPAANHAAFMEQIPFYALRSIVRPGITGWAQVRYGYANDLDEEIEKMCFDLYYIRNVSIWLDLRVLLATVGVVARGQEGSDFGMQPMLSATGK